RRQLSQEPGSGFWIISSVTGDMLSSRSDCAAAGSEVRTRAVPSSSAESAFIFICFSSVKIFGHESAVAGASVKTHLPEKPGALHAIERAGRQSASRSESFQMLDAEDDSPPGKPGGSVVAKESYRKMPISSGVTGPRVLPQ